jgi:hypothetical protein
VTIVVLLILASLWVGVLLPSVLRSREAVHSTDSVGDFRRQLWVLARTRRASLGMAYSSPPAPLPRRPVATAGPAVTNRSMVSDRAPVMAARQPVAWTTRQHTLRRRREVLKVLLLGIMGTFVIGAFPGMRMAWAVTMGLGAVMFTYLAALVHLRGLAVERSSKVALIHPRQGPEPALALRRSVN